MNEQIKALAELAGMPMDQYNNLMWSELDSDEKKEFLEKFAELIVEECAKVLWDSNDILGEYCIKKHFGVE